MLNGFDKKREYEIEESDREVVERHNVLSSNVLYAIRSIALTSDSSNAHT